MLDEILKAVNKELALDKFEIDRLMDERDRALRKAEDLKRELDRKVEDLSAREESLSALVAKQNEELSVLRDSVLLDWKRRYEKLTGHHGRTVDKLQRQLAEQAEDMQRMAAEIRRLQAEIAERAEKHIAVRDENMKLWAERMRIHDQEQRAISMTLAAGPVHEENERLWCENQLLKADLVKRDPEEAKRYAF